MSYEKDISRAIEASTPIWRMINENFSWDIADTTTPPPYLVAQTLHETGDTLHDGSRDVTFPTIQFSAWATTKIESINIVEKVRRCIEGTNLPGPSKIAFIFDSKHSTYDDDAKLFGTILRLRGAAQIQ